jgi:lipopolysaccharide export system protein LptA
MTHTTRGLVLALSLCFASLTHAERADRQKPVELEADRVTVDDAKQTQVFEGNVHLVQGTLEVRSHKLDVIQDSAGFQRAIASGNKAAQAWFKQRREGRGDYVEGRADRIEHDSKNEITEFFGKAHVKNGADEVTGPYIRYDGKSQNYVVNSQPGTASSTPTPGGGRVRAVIQPKNQPEAAAPVTPAPAIK